MTKQEMKIGDRVYYTGDRANLPSWGTVVKLRARTAYGPESVDIKFDDSRFEGDESQYSRGIYLSMFDASPGQRFYTEADWEAKRAAYIKASEEQYRKMGLIN